MLSKKAALKLTEIADRIAEERIFPILEEEQEKARGAGISETLSIAVLRIAALNTLVGIMTSHLVSCKETSEDNARELAQELYDQLMGVIEGFMLKHGAELFSVDLGSEGGAP